MRPKTLRQVEGFDGYAVCFQNLLAVADRVERSGTRADAADAQIPHPVGDRHTAANHPRSFRNSAESGALRCAARQRVRDPILPQIVARRHLAAEAVAAMRDRHLRGVVRCRLHQHGNVQPGQAHRVGDGAFVAEIRQSNDDAVDPVALFPKQRRAAFWLLRASRLRRTFCLRTQHHRFDASLDRARASFLRGPTLPDGPGRIRGSRRSGPMSFCF